MSLDDEFNQVESETSQINNRRRQQVMARLEGHRTNKKSSTQEPATRAQELIDRARAELERGTPSEETERQIVALLALDAVGRNELRLKDVLADIRKALLDKDAPKGTAAFSFQKKSKPAKTEEVVNVAVEEKKEEAGGEEIVFDDKEIVIKNETDLTRCFSLPEGSAIRVVSCRGCRLSFPFPVSTVHLLDVHDSLLVFPHIDSSILIRDCEKLRLFAVAQQARVHGVADSELHVSVSGATVIETCKGIAIAPARILQNGQEVDVGDRVHWNNVKDFDWLASTPSPNWHVMEEAVCVDTATFSISA